MAERQSDEMQGEITPDGIQRMRNRIGNLIPQPKPFNTEASEDSIRHHAFSYGDDNPLWCDAEYGAKTRWGSAIGAPGYVGTMGVSVASPIPPEVRAKGAGALRGVPNYLSGSSWTWVRPVYPGDRVFKRYYIAKVEEKRSEFGGGKAVVVHHKHEFTNSRNEVVAIMRNYFFHVEREASEKTGKYAEIEQPRYDEDELARIDEAYASEIVRGGEPRYWEDVKEGETLPTMVRGPLCVTDILLWHSGRGFGAMFGVAALKMGYENRRKVPAFYTRNEYNAWDVAQRVHWDNARAQRVGNPRAYDYGSMRTHWITNFLTNWMGDDGWLLKQSDQIRRFNFMGDTSWVHGKIVRKYAEGKRHMVDLELWAENQRGEVTAPGEATIILPSREHGPVVLPGEAGEFKPSVQNTDYSVIVEE
ncbi:MAG: MaoC family dehydratase N-terminal domain-containing protein [Chloroflexi bacterium]|nr:MaoC family dehydratase N-terminal domain-containing protein [Chloroflexota bacterium]